MQGDALQETRKQKAITGMDTQGGAFWDEVLKYIFSRVTNYCQCLEIVLSVELDLMVMDFPSNHTRDSTDEVHCTLSISVQVLSSKLDC